jgi:peptidoglycan/LPS O-acetylase OafA/YrhL
MANAPQQAPALPLPERAFRPDLQGLRAVAVVLVMLNHAGIVALGGGFIGVDVFFVLSGYLITGLLLREHARSGGISLVNFYARRARRLLPAGAVVLVATVIASYRLDGISAGNRAAEDATWASLFASNIREIREGTDYLGAQAAPSALQHFWSLAVEEQFYLVWPLLILATAIAGTRFPIRIRLGIVLGAVALASLAWSIHQTNFDATTAYFSPLTRAFELAAGGLLAVAAPSLRGIRPRIGIVLGWTGLATILATAFLFDAATAFPGSAAVWPVLATTFAIAGGVIAPGLGAETILRRQPFQWIGTLSYSLYLWHWPVLIIAAGAAGRELTVTENLLLYIPVVALSALTFAFVEDPIRVSSLLGNRPPTVSIAFGAMLIAVTIGIASWFVAAHARPPDNAPMPESPSADAVLQEVAEGAFVTDWPVQPPRIENRAYSDECDVSRTERTSAACVHGNPDASRTAVVYGDSHAAMWIPAFDRIGAESDWRIVQLTKPGCPVADYPSYSQVLGRENTECAAFRDFTVETIEQIRPDVVIMSAARRTAIVSVDGEPSRDGAVIADAWEPGLAATLDRIAPHTGRMVLLGDMAYASESGTDCLTDHPTDVTRCTTPLAEAIHADHNAMEARVAREHGAEYVDIIPWFCTDTVCPAIIGGLTVRHDALHISENYAVWLSNALAGATGLDP